MSIKSVEYIMCVDQKTDWEARLREIGLNREAFSIRPHGEARNLLTFWERDRNEALRILELLDSR